MTNIKEKTNGYKVILLEYMIITFPKKNVIKLFSYLKIKINLKKHLIKKQVENSLF